MKLAMKFALLALFSLVAAAASIASAQDYPTRPITLVVPYAAGGGNDVMARIVAEKMSKRSASRSWSRTAPAPAARSRRAQVAKAAPDGYTLVLGGTGSLAVNPTLYSNVGYDPRKDFAPVGLIGTSAAHRRGQPHRRRPRPIPELIALAKKEPGKLSYASAGVGSGIHLGAVLFELMAGVKLTHVPYRAPAPALTDLIGGHVQIYFSSIPLRDRHRQGGQGARACRDRTRSARRYSPTADRCRNGCRASRRCCITASSRRPARRKPIVDKLNAALREAVADARHQGAHGHRRHRAAASTPEEYAADIDKEETKWSAIVKKSGAKAQ